MRGGQRFTDLAAFAFNKAKIAAVVREMTSARRSSSAGQSRPFSDLVSG